MLIKESQLRAIIREELLIESIILNENVDSSVKSLLLSEGMLKTAMKNTLVAALIMSKVLGGVSPADAKKYEEDPGASSPAVVKIVKKMKGVGWGSDYTVKKIKQIDQSIKKLKEACKIADASYGDDVKTSQDRADKYQKKFFKFLKRIEPIVDKCEQKSNEIKDFQKKLENIENESVKESLENKLNEKTNSLLKLIDKLQRAVEKYKKGA